MAYIVKATVNLELVGQGPIYSKTHSISEAEGVWHELQLATASVDSAVNFGGVTTGDIVLLSSDQTISWRCNAADTAIAQDANRVHLLVGTAQESGLGGINAHNTGLKGLRAANQFPILANDQHVARVEAFGGGKHFGKIGGR